MNMSGMFGEDVKKAVSLKSIFIWDVCVFCDEGKNIFFNGVVNLYIYVIC